MTAPTTAAAAPTTPAAVVDEFLRLIMLPDPVAARRYTAPGLAIRFTGGRAMADPTECTAFNKSRYAWVKKRIERTETVAAILVHATHAGASAPGASAPSAAPAAPAAPADPQEVVVYSLGTLYGEWPDGTPFEGNRYVDRYVVRGGLITHMDVWNDSAEWLLLRQPLRVGLASL